MRTADVLESYLAALTTSDLELIAKSFAYNATWTLHGTLPISGTKVGRDAIMEFLVGGAELYRTGSQRIMFGQRTIQGNRAVLEWQVRGVAEATGLDYHNNYCGVFVVEGSEIVEVREYLDTQHAAETLYPLDRWTPTTPE
ncbi:nuclear transport factor 2 family protein [Rhodococcoides fascians]|uniref:nuclear transport factor 2 family protein n=1 Tax=Rhodococcoides fascians TaxID=1828 RepID=UPI00050CE169|nr:nuclear transport factor 2 family protein [Rhodococcus fascians]